MPSEETHPGKFGNSCHLPPVTATSQPSQVAKWPHAVINISNSGDASGGQRTTPALTGAIAEIERLQRVLKLTSGGETVLCPDLMLLNTCQVKQRAKFWGAIKAADRVHFIILVDDAERLTDLLPKDWGAGYSNVCLATVLDAGEEGANQLKIGKLLAVPARYRAFFIPPFVNLEQLTDWSFAGAWVIADTDARLSAANSERSEDWVRDTQKSCIRRGVPFYHNGAPNELCLSGSGNDSALPEHPFKGRVGESIDLHRTSVTVDRNRNSVSEQRTIQACVFSPETAPKVKSVNEFDFAQPGSTLDSIGSESDTPAQSRSNSEATTIFSASAGPAVAKSPEVECAPVGLQTPNPENSEVLAEVGAADCLIVEPAPAESECIAAVITEAENLAGLFLKLDDELRTGLRGFLRAARAYRRIRDESLWRYGNYESWHEYCETIAELDPSYVNRLIKGAEVCEVIDLNNPPVDEVGNAVLPKNEAQCRALSSLREPKLIAKAWKAAVKVSNGRPTAAVVSAQANKLRHKNLPKPTESPAQSRQSLRLDLIRRFRETAEARASWETVLELVTLLEATWK